MTRRTSAWVRDGHNRRTLRNPGGYLLSAQCKDRIWIGWTPDPQQTTTMIRAWCPFPIRDIEFRTMTRDKVLAGSPARKANCFCVSPRISRNRNSFFTASAKPSSRVGMFFWYMLPRWVGGNWKFTICQLTFG